MNDTYELRDESGNLKANIHLKMAKWIYNKTVMPLSLDMGM